MTWIQTQSGRAFDLIDPRAEDVNVGEVVAESPAGLPTEGGVDWWLSEVERVPLTDTVTCEVRGDVMRELLRVYREQTRRAA